MLGTLQESDMAETLMVLARDEPLPLDADLPGRIGPLPPQKAADLGAAWFENGALVQNEAHRGPIRLDQAVATDNPAVQTQQVLRVKLADFFRYSRAVSFANKGD